MGKRVGQGILLIKMDQLEWETVPGGFKVKVLARGDRFITGIGVGQPGGGETWHKHAAEVEETCYVLKGKGKASWKSNGEVNHIEFSEGDLLYFPYGIENMFVNTGHEDLWLLFSITNASKLRE
jgi:oxalate decarboxylase/phosphoglucose isomerase-like protein (cupin superfamily)